MNIDRLKAGQRPDVLPPKPRRSANPFLDGLKASLQAAEAYTLPAVSPGDVKAVCRKIRRAAELLDFGVNIRTRDVPSGVLITYQAKAKTVYRRGPEC